MHRSALGTLMFSEIIRKLSRCYLPVNPKKIKYSIYECISLIFLSCVIIVNTFGSDIVFQKLLSPFYRLNIFYI